MQLNALSSELAGIVGNVSPVSQGVGTVTTGWIDASKFHQFMAIVTAGVLGAAATLDAKLEQATDGAGAGAKDVTGKAITQLTKAGADDNKQVVINLSPSQHLDIDNGFDYFRLSMTVGAAASLIAGVVLGLNARLGVASDNDATTVDEIK